MYKSNIHLYILTRDTNQNKIETLKTRAQEENGLLVFFHNSKGWEMSIMSTKKKRRKEKENRKIKKFKKYKLTEKSVLNWVQSKDWSNLFVFNNCSYHYFVCTRTESFASVQDYSPKIIRILQN